VSSPQPPVGYGRTPPAGLKMSPPLHPTPTTPEEAHYRASEWLYAWIDEDPQARAGYGAHEERFEALCAAAVPLFAHGALSIELAVVDGERGRMYAATVVGIVDPKSGVHHLRYGPGATGEPEAALRAISEEIAAG